MMGICRYIHRDRWEYVDTLIDVICDCVTNCMAPIKTICCHEQMQCLLISLT